MDAPPAAGISAFCNGSQHFPGSKWRSTARQGLGACRTTPALLFRLEALLNRLSLGGLSAPVPGSALAAYPEPTAAASCILDLCGDAEGGPDLPVWRLGFDGVAGEGALLAALLAGRSPVATLSTDGRIIASGRFGAEDRGTMLTAFEDGLIRSMTLIVARCCRAPGRFSGTAYRCRPRRPP